MNLKKLLTGSTKVSQAPTEVKQPVDGNAAGIVHTANEPKPETKVETKPTKELSCICGHPIGAHDDCGPCGILECGCPRFASDSPEVELDTEDVDLKLAKLIDEEFDEPSMDLSELPGDHCHHLCENPDCQKWWSHGPKKDCTYPDLMKQGLCQECNNGVTDQIDFEDQFEIKDGKPRLTATALIKVKNEVGERVKDMNVAQLTAHILYNQMRIQEMHEANLHVSKIRRIKEEEEAANIPESEREKFIQALRKGEDTGKKPRKPRATKAKSEKSSSSATDAKKAKKAELIRQMRSEGMAKEVAEAIAGMMVQTGKSREVAEAWFNE